MGRKNHPHRYKTLYILRGLPGTGKTRKARALQMTHGGVIISADDYFRDDSGEIRRKNGELHKAHVWARQMALRAMDNEENPVIIDNTNMAHWEMFPYVMMILFVSVLATMSLDTIRDPAKAPKFSSQSLSEMGWYLYEVHSNVWLKGNFLLSGYRRFYWIKFIVMKDTWRVSLDELYKRCKGKVPFEKLEHMKNSYQSVRHIFDVFRDKRSQEWWSDPEMIDNGWYCCMTVSENSDSYSNSDYDNYSDNW